MARRRLQRRSTLRCPRTFDLPRRHQRTRTRRLGESALERLQLARANEAVHRRTVNGSCTAGFSTMYYLIHSDPGAYETAHISAQSHLHEAVTKTREGPTARGRSRGKPRGPDHPSGFLLPGRNARRPLRVGACRTEPSTSHLHSASRWPRRKPGSFFVRSTPPALSRPGCLQ